MTDNLIFLHDLQIDILFGFYIGEDQKIEVWGKLVLALRIVKKNIFFLSIDLSDSDSDITFTPEHY